MRGRASAPSQLRRKSRRFAAPRAEWLEPKQLLAIFTVTSANDAGAGTLRQAIQMANQSPETDTINFNITPSGTKSIPLATALPPIDGGVTIDGTTQPGYDPANPSPMIELNGTAITGSSNGLVIQTSTRPGTAGIGSVVRGLAIGGFTGDGIVLEGDGHRVEGSYIGLDLTGAVVRANSSDGISLDSSSRTTIGGTTAASRNVISGNLGNGIVVNGLTPTSSTANRFIGNYIGTDDTGTIAVGNGSNGVFFFGFMRGNTVGGTTAAERNVISGNDGNGVFFQSSSRNSVVGNYIGTTADGTQALGNGASGVAGLGSANTVGGATTGERNVISGNEGPGVSFLGGLTEDGVPVPNLVQGNYIGTDFSGQDALGNVEAGVRLFTDNAIIGGNSAATGNRIAYTRRDVFGRAAGVSMVLSSSNNAILSNEIFANGGLGIDFNNDGMALPNDPLDADGSGLSNQGQNHPVLDEVETGGGVTFARGTINSTPRTSLLLQFFASDQVDPSGFGEGQTFLGEATVTTDGMGNASFDVGFPVELTGSQFVSATATDPFNNTSEFSESFQASLLPASDLSVTTAMTPSPVTVGQELTVSVTVSNAGPTASSGVVVTDRLPIGSAFVRSADGFQADATGAVVADLGSIPAGQSRTVSYVVRPGVVGTIANGVVVSNDQIDPMPGNNVASAQVAVQPMPGQSVLALASVAVAASEDEGVIRVTVTRSNGTEPVSVRFATGGGTATSGVDYMPASGTLDFAQGEVSKTIDIPLTDDLDIEGDETIIVTLSQPAGNAVLGLPTQATLTIVDDDPTPPPAGRFRLGGSTFNASESGEFVTIPVERVGGVEGEVRVRIRTVDLSAVAGTDYEPIDFEVVFSPNDPAPKLVQIRLINDSVFRPNRTFGVELVDPVNAPLDVPSAATVTVTDDDPSPTPPQQQRFRLDQASFAASEASRSVPVVVRRDSGAGAVSVVFQAVAGTAVANQRFTPVNVTVQFAEGETSKVVEVPLLDTSQAEGSQTVLLSLTMPAGGPQLGDPSTATLTILDDEQGPTPPPVSPGTVRFVSGLDTVSESAGAATITLERVGGSDGRVTLFVIPSAGEARPGVDYDADPIPVVFEAGQTRVTIALPILDNQDRDGDRAVGLFMTPPTGGAALDPITSSVLVIADDEVDVVDPTPPTVANVRFVGPAGAPIGLAVTFSEVIDPSRALDPRAYDLVIPRGDRTLLSIVDISYDPATRTVAMVTSSPLRVGETYRLTVASAGDLAITDLDGNALVGDGSQVLITRASTHQYLDANGDRVSLRIQGGALLDVIRVPDQDADVINVVPTRSGRKLLTGNVQRSRGRGDGATTIGRIDGDEPFGLVNVRFNPRQFAVGEITPSAVDALLASPAASSLRATRVRRG